MRKKLKCSVFQLSQRISKPKVPSNWNAHFLNYFLYEFLSPVLLKGEGDTIWSCYLIKWIKQYWVIWSCIFFLFSSVTQSGPTLCSPMNRSMPGLPVHHQLLELTETHVHQVSDAIQPSRPLSSPSPPAPNPSQLQGLFQ